MEAAAIVRVDADRRAGRHAAHVCRASVPLRARLPQDAPRERQLPAGGGDTGPLAALRGVPAVISRANGVYHHDPAWYRSFLYTAERERGLDDSEDLLSPGTLTFDLSGAAAVWMLEAEQPLR